MKMTPLSKLVSKFQLARSCRREEAEITAKSRPSASLPRQLRIVKPLLSALAALGFAGVLSGCASAEPAVNKNAAALVPETVFITFHVKPGKEAELQQALAEAWKIYRHEKLVLAEPHVVIAGKEGSGTRVIEIFTWVNHNIPDHAPDSVKAMWNRMHALCEERDGHPALEGGEVERIVPPLQ
jgi:hypothetical protein